ncbi:uncharacterized protein SI:DKEY-154B15.1 isoform X2 [Latimeria chalumnae]|nr:PREDICTED: RNA-binding protein 43 [Latimeria chalumnae]|eukprot:XP_006012723.1 PREDICTED: RNA-binding protein 43 [Latimeria chalumnae]
MTRDRRKIQVRKIPHILPDDTMIDKLLIHFLRPRNGGGEVMGVDYPTNERGQAFVTFEDEQVAEEVLKRQHFLQLQGKSYPLEVNRVNEGYGVYMPIRTTLDLRPFPNIEEVTALLKKYNFKILSQEGSLVEIKGFFPELTKLRCELLRVYSVHPQRTSPSHLQKITGLQSIVKESHNGLHNGSNIGSVSQRDPSYFTSNGYPLASTVRKFHQSQPELQRHYGYNDSDNAKEHLGISPTSQGYNSSRGLDGSTVNGSSSSRSPLSLQDSITFLSSASNHSVSPESGRQLAGLSKSQSPRVGSNFLGSSPPYGASRASSITVDGDTLKYTQAFHKHEIEQVLDTFSVTMSVEESADVSLVTLTSKCFSSSSHTAVESACQQLSSLLSGKQQYLRTQNVDLAGLPYKEQSQLMDRCKQLERIYNVLVIKYSDRLHLIGPSLDSYEMQQKLLGKVSFDDSTVKSKILNKLRVKRDLSCPPLVSRGNARCIEETSPLGIQDYSPGKYAEEKPKSEVQEKQADVQSRQNSTRSKKQVRRSISESRAEKLKAKKPTSPLPVVDSHDLQSQRERGRSVEKKVQDHKSNTKLNIAKPQLIPDFRNITDIKKLLGKKRLDKN